MPKLPTHVKGHRYWNNDISNDDIGGLSWVEEACVALEESQNDVEDESEPRAIRREPSLERQIVE